MFMRPQERREGTSLTSARRPVEIYLEVNDVDAYHNQVKKQGVKISDPLTDQWWGDRTFTVMDPFGYQIWFYQTVGEPVPPQGAKIV
jgi:PhnB protein